MYTPTRNNEYRFSLTNGRRVYYNRISGYGVEHDGQYLVAPTAAESMEIMGKEAERAKRRIDDDDAFATECELDKQANLRLSNERGIDDMSDTLFPATKEPANTDRW